MRTTFKRRPATPAESSKALAQLRTLFATKPRDRAEADLRREAAEERMRRAKALATRAARAVLDGLPLGPVLADAANEEVEAALAELRALDAP